MSYNSILTLLPKVSARPHRLRAQSHKTALTSDAIHGLRWSPGLLANQVLISVPTIPSHDSIIGYNGSQNSATLTYIYWFIIQHVVESTDEQPDEEIQRVSLEESEHRSVCPRGV